MHRKQVAADVMPLERKSLEDIPAEVVAAFFHGLDDVEHGRTVSVTSAVTEGRRRIDEYRANKQIVDDPPRQQRK